ncbi:MAG: prepilin-type N-terminal cleavage/methylation domain-containing protein [Opitutaceae bacterium]|jgi:prepilin-type N-terminal cleavage/methylation domain-containing protein
MITTTPYPARNRRRCGMTLIELIVATTLGGLIMTGVLTVYLFIGRTGVNTGNYMDMEQQSRNSLEHFAQDARQASSITWNSSTQISLIVNSTTVTYSYNSGTKQFSRITGGVTTKLLDGISNFQFIGYKLNGDTVSLTDLTQAGVNTKQIQLSLKAERSSRTAAGVSNTVLSARYILRNKTNTS